MSETRKYLRYCARSLSISAFVTSVLITSVSAAEEPLYGLRLSEAVQLRIPRVDGVPDVFFSNLLGAGAMLQLGGVEFMPQIKLIYSSSQIEVTDASGTTKSSAEGVGVEAGVRFAVGWFEREKGGFYFFADPAFSYWTLSGTFSSGDKYSAKVVEFGTEFGIGGKVYVNEKFRIDLFASLVHIGVRPSEEEIVGVTSYPSLGFAVERTWL